MEFDMWAFLVEQLFGGFWLAVIGVGVFIFLIMQVFGRMSRLTTINYLMLYGLTMTAGYGYKWITALISFALMSWVFLEWKNWSGG